ALGDLEGILHGVIAAGGGRCVGADIGRSVRRGAEDVDRSAALVIGLDGVLVGGDVDAFGLTSKWTSWPGSQFSTARVTPLSSLAKSGASIVFGDTVRLASAGASGSSSSTTVMVPLRVSDSVPSRSMVTSKGTSPGSRLSGLPSHQTWRTWSPSASAVSVFPVRESLMRSPFLTPETVTSTPLS